MINKVYNYTISKTKIIEKIVNDDVAMINHMVLPKDECLPVHNANSNVYMIVAEGAVTLELDGTPPETYPKGSILNIEYGTLMSVCNTSDDILELFVVKAPGPSHYNKQP
ncbi:MAG: cupin domain-containing protein [Clostridia bacterium]|nr:cupin domain-containing protein [Clostridia bacterium]